MNGSDKGRDADGRFLPGQSGNPAGKKPGTRNRATLLREALREGEDTLLARSIIDRAKSGDGVALRFVLGLLIPRRRGRPIELDLPDCTDAGDTVAAFDATVRAMAAGEISPDEALTVTRVLEGRHKALTAWQTARQPTRRDKQPSPSGDAQSKPPRSGDAQSKPSPSGRGQGEGIRLARVVADKNASRCPHPDALRKGEEANLAGREDIALAADGTVLLHSACILPPRAGAGTSPYDDLRTRRAA